MKNSIEVEAALRLALEALKSVLTDPDGNVCWQGSYADRDIIGDALDEFEKFLAQPALASEQKRPQNCGTGYCSCIECVMEPEPVAWGMSSAEGGFVVDCITPEEHDRVEGGYTIPLYTTPPYVPTERPVPETHKRTAAEGEDTQRAWVGLSDKEISEASKHFTQWEGFMHGAYWAQEKLKESNTRNGGCL